MTEALHEPEPAPIAGRSWSPLRLIAIPVMVAGVIRAATGLFTWFSVKHRMAEEQITVSSDSYHFSGRTVDGPVAAFERASTIKHHELEGTGGKTYAQLDRDDPLRATAMDVSFRCCPDADPRGVFADHQPHGSPDLASLGTK